MESLLKISLILSSAIAMHVSFTAPHTPTSDNVQVVHDSFIEWILIHDVKYGLPITKAISWAVTFAEVAITASHAIDPNTLPSGIQDAVGFLGTIQDVPITSYFMFGTALIVVGGFIRWWCFWTLGRFFTFKLSVRKGHKLVTTGPYAVVRHPSYAGAALLSIGLCILHGSWSSLIRRSGVLNIPGLTAIMVGVLVGRLVVAASLVLRIRHEDEIVKSISRVEWENWVKVVRYRLIPGIY